MKDTVYLTLNKSGVVNMRKAPPTLEGGQIAVRIHVQAPLAVFRNSHPDVHIGISEEHVMLPTPSVTILPATPPDDND